MYLYGRAIDLSAPKAIQSGAYFAKDEVRRVEKGKDMDPPLSPKSKNGMPLVPKLQE